MKAILVPSIALAMLASSIPAFAASDPPKSDNASTSMESAFSLRLDQLEKEIHQLELKDKLNQDEKQKTNEQQQKKIRQQNKQWEDSLMGIYG
jgi:hypothetical protein